VSPATLEEIRDVGAGESYPRRLLDECDDALVLFAAGFLGMQDAFWVAEAGKRATCVDIRPDLLAGMAAVYPEDWEFVTGDVYDYTERMELVGRRWDLVSLDCPSSHFDRCAELAGLWCRLAGRAVVLGTSGRTALAAPDGWEVTERRFRSMNYGGTFWAVLERC
jgi:hypothetical protein